MQSRASPPPNQALECHPALLNNWWYIGPIGIPINLDRDGNDGLPGECRLEEPHANEMRVDDRRQERVAQHDGTDDDANKDENLRVSHYFHGVVVVGSNPDLKLLRKGVRGRRTTCRSWWSGLENLGHHSRTSER